MNKVKGWKCYDENLKCKGIQFEVGKTYEHKGEIKLCESGFHFHEHPKDVFKYYDKKSRVCEIEAYDVLSDTDKSVCKKIIIFKEIKAIERYLLGYGHGYGSGYGSGYGDGSGYGCGHGDGYGYGDGDGDGYGYGDGDGDGSGYGCGCGHGDNNFIFERSFKCFI